MKLNVGDEVILLEEGRSWFGKYTGTIAKITKIYFDKNIIIVLLYDGREVLSSTKWVSDPKYTQNDLWKKLEGDDED